MTEAQCRNNNYQNERGDRGLSTIDLNLTKILLN